MTRIKTKRVYEPKAPRDGTRILVMRLWPRGIKKSHVDSWLKDLGAESSRIKAWKAGKISWPEFRRRYLAGLKKPAAQAQLRELKALAKTSPVTLLCACPDEARCHRGLLKQLLTEDHRCVPLQSGESLSGCGGPQSPKSTRLTFEVDII